MKKGRHRSGSLSCNKELCLEQVTCVDVEGALAILILDEGILAELAHWQAILKGYDKVLVHDEAQATTNGDVWAVTLLALSHILVIACAVLLLALEAHVVVLRNHGTIREDIQAE